MSEILGTSIDKHHRLGRPGVLFVAQSTLSDEVLNNYSLSCTGYKRGGTYRKFSPGDPGADNAKRMLNGWGWEWRGAERIMAINWENRLEQKVGPSESP